MNFKKKVLVLLVIISLVLFEVLSAQAAGDAPSGDTLGRLQEESEKIKELMEKYKNVKLDKYNQSIVFVHDENGKPVDITLRIYYNDQVQERISTSKGRFDNVFNHGANVPEAVLSLAVEKHPEDKSCQILAIKIAGPKFVAVQAYFEKLKLLLENEIQKKATDMTIEKVIEKTLSALGWTAENVSVFLEGFKIGKDLATPVKDFLEKKFEEIIQSAKEQNAVVRKTLVDETNPSYEEAAHGGWIGLFRENVGIEKVSLTDRFFPRYHKPVTQFKYDITLRCQKAKPAENLQWREVSYYFRIRQRDAEDVDINFAPEESAGGQTGISSIIVEDKLKSAIAQTFFKAGLAPDSPWYFIDNAAEIINLAFTFNSESKIKKIWKYQEEKLAEMEEAAIKNQPEVFSLAGERYQTLLNQLNVALAVAKKDQTEEKFGDLLDLKITAHQFILSAIADNIRGPIKPLVEKIREKLPEVSAERLRGLIGDSPTVRYEDIKDKNKPAETAKPEPVKKDSGEKTSVEKPKTPATSEPDKTPVKKPANVCGDSIIAGAEECDPPGKKNGCYEEEICGKNCLCEYIVEKEICGDNRLGFSETCDGNQFSQPCLDSLEDYQKIYSNPNLTLRCFNNCRGCEINVIRE